MDFDINSKIDWTYYDTNTGECDDIREHMLHKYTIKSLIDSYTIMDNIDLYLAGNHDPISGCRWTVIFRIIKE